MRTHLGPFFERATLRVTVREDEVSAEEQVRYVACLGAELDEIGGDGAWAARIELVPSSDLAGGVSSSLVRREVAGGNAGLDGLVAGGVRRWIVEEGLYV
jgi:nicotinamide-nucleotide adenylyltransferase